jgi:hypothetical protein
MSDLKTKINNRMDHLQVLMEGQAHIDRPEYVNDVIESVSKFWTVLSDEDKDYIHCARDALENKTDWNV